MSVEEVDKEVDQMSKVEKKIFKTNFNFDRKENFLAILRISTTCRRR